MKKKVRLCPSCGLFYAEAPAVSRRDPRVSICPDCGIREALADYSFAKLFGPTMAVFEAARKAADSARSV